MLNSINYLNKHYNLNPEKIIFEDLNQSYTIREFYNLVNQYPNNLTQYQNKNIGIIGFNSVNYAAADCGVSSTNNTLVPIPNFFNEFNFFSFKSSGLHSSVTSALSVIE